MKYTCEVIIKKPKNQVANLFHIRRKYYNWNLNAQWPFPEDIIIWNINGTRNTQLVDNLKYN
jgi:hypothetical protein